MFVDELTITAAAGAGGAGVVRWRHEKFKPLAGPAGGNGGRGGSVYLRAVADNNRLSKYTGKPEFIAAAGEDGRGSSQHGHNAPDLYIDVPTGSQVTDQDRGLVYTLTTPGETVLILRGGAGGLGNEHFKSATNRSPQQATLGKPGEQATLRIEVALVVAAGLIGLPNAGKSSLLTALTNATPQVGSYPFTTREPHLGDLAGHTLADIPGLIAGAAQGKGLGHKFLRHITRTKMLLHVVSLESADPVTDYYTIRAELDQYDHALTDKREWIILSKKDVANESFIDETKNKFDKCADRVLVVSILDDDSVKYLAQELRTALSAGDDVNGRTD